MKRLTKIASAAVSMAMLVGVVAGCNSQQSATTTAAATTAAATTAAPAATEEEEDLGFSEVEIFTGVQKEFLNLNAVYFQPVDMTGGYKAADYDCHLELDVSALENGYGYGKDDWVPYLTVEYVVTKNGGDFKTSGTFMPMAASDGPHYGANIKMDGDGLYTVTFTVKFPDSSTYLIHTDNTGPDKHDFPANIEYTCDNWQFTNGAWAE